MNKILILLSLIICHSWCISGVHHTYWSGIWDNAQSGSINWYRSEKIVTLVIPTIIDAVNSSNHITITNVLPADLRPQPSITGIGYSNVIYVVDNGAVVNGNLLVKSDGAIEVYVLYINNFQNRGNGGLLETHVSYVVDI